MAVSDVHFGNGRGSEDLKGIDKGKSYYYLFNFETSAMFGIVCGNNGAPATLQLFYQCDLTSLETREIVTFVMNASYFRVHNLE